MYKNGTKTIAESNQTFKPQESEMVVWTIDYDLGV